MLRLPATDRITDGMYNYPFNYRGPIVGDARLFRGVARVGEKAPDFTIMTLTGESMKLSEYIDGTYGVLEFGSIT